MAPCMDTGRYAADQWEQQQHLLVHKHQVASVPRAPSPPWWSNSYRGEDEHPVLQGRTELLPKEVARSQQQSHRCDPICAFFGFLSCQELEEKSCISVIVVGTGWGTDFPLSWKDFKTSHYQKVYKGWDFKSVLREAKNLLEINGN